MNIVRKDEVNRIEYLARDDKIPKIVGKAILSTRDKSEYKLKQIRIDRNYRRKGKGSNLLNRILSDFPYQKIRMETWTHLEDWYNKHGFISLGGGNKTEMVKQSWFIPHNTIGVING